MDEFQAALLEHGLDEQTIDALPAVSEEELKEMMAGYEEDDQLQEAGEQTNGAEEKNKDTMEQAQKQGTRKRLFKSSVIVAGSTKMRNAVALVSPRKRAAARMGTRKGDTNKELESKETKQEFEFAQKFQGHFGFDNLVTVDPVGRSGGLALYYNNEYQVNVLYSSNRMIDVEAVALGKTVYMTFVYGDPVQDLREQVWERLTRYGISRSEPWNYGLLEFPVKGNKLSLQGRRGKGKGAVTVRCRLDRALANEEWHTLFPCSYTEYLGLVASDHRPVVAYLEDKVIRRKGQFRFDKRWVGQEGLMESITRGWSDNNEGTRTGIVEQISNCRREIAKWRKNNPPYGKEKIADLQKALEEVQTDDSRSQEDIMEVSRKLQEAYKDEEEYWHQKSRNMWYSSGDLNTKFYHALTKQRRARNMIVGLHDGEGNWITEDNGIERVAVEYF
ncbi:uncharacterized protein LOC125584535 [Brassica napus]|uniref:uncharacterized protein LOC125584535 n=1 Tax=Brassica napus TaxID=3708 RepID=UPI002078ABD6|nr:uncharacterized protein LOC125584535 [Brassica napus]